jgi:glycosyltransferase involved in cell wall biosynthesis
MKNGRRKREPVVLEKGDFSASLDVDRQILNLDGKRVSLDAAIDRRNGEAVESPIKTAVLVLGMHRSGTSSVAGALIQLGGAAPHNLLPPQADNPTGFWESSVLMALNDEILSAGGSDWRDWRKFDSTRIDATAAAALRARAGSALSGEFGDATLAIVKDPRMCRLLPFWSSVFHEAGWAVRPLLLLRSPLEVALSLNRRDGIALSHGCLIWLRHVLDAEAETRNVRRAVLSWNDFLADRRGALELLGEQLDLTWPRWSDSAVAEIDGFVSADLKHQSSSEQDLRVHPAVSALVRETNAAMIGLAEDPSNGRIWRKLDDIRTRFEDAVATFGQAMFETEEESRRLQSLAMHEFAAQFAALQREFVSQLAAERDNFASQFAAVRGEHAALMAERDARLAEKDVLIADKNRLIAEREREISRMEAALADSEKELAQKEALLAEQSNLHARARFEQEEARAAAERDRDFLVRYLTRTYQRPWRPFKYYVNYHLLRSFSALTAPFSKRMASRFARSAQKRSPSRFNAYLAENAAVPAVPSSNVADDESVELKRLRSRWLPDSPTRAARRVITAHGLFDEAFYRAQAADVGRDSITHYIETGGSSGLWPHSLFDPAWYLEKYPDVRDAGIDPFVHFLQAGGQEGRWPNAFFDPRWYVARASGAQLSAEVLRHYLEVGAPAGINPSPEFDLAWYIEYNPDVAAAGVNPFVHFLHHGRAEGRLACKPAVYKDGEEVGRAHLQCLKYETPGAEVALFVTHSSDGRVKPHVRRHIEALAAQGIDVFLLIAADRVFQEDAGWIKSVPRALFIRENIGFDFAYWAHILRRHRALYNREILYLLNDSLFGPVNDDAFAAMIAKVRASVADVVGLTESRECGWHVQSYFLAVKKGALGSFAFQNFVLGIRSHQDKDDVINAYEVTFAPSMREAGLAVEVLYKSDSIFNSTIYHWRELLEEGFPFLKIMTVRDDIPGVAKTGWREILDSLGYDVRLADAVLASYGGAAPGEHLPRGASLTGPGHAEIYPGAPRLAFISPFNFDNGLGVAGRGYVQALMHTSIAHNLLAIRPPFYIHKRVSPSIDRLDFVGAADVAILQVNPDGWDSLVTSDQKAAFEMARRKVGLFFWESRKLPPSYVDAARKLDAIWAPSSYCAEAFQAAGAHRVDIIPCVVEACGQNVSEEERVALRRKLGLASDERVILYSFDASSYLIRKNPAALALAFDATGLWRDGWRLVLKTKHLEHSPDSEAQELAVLAGKIAGVLLVNRPMGAAELRALNSIVDIYASSHCSEGFGLTIAEALAAGKTVVATDFGGSRDFLDETVGFPVEAHPVELDRDYGAYKRGVVWASVDEGRLAERLREAATLSPEARAALGERASTRMAESFSAKAIGARIERVVADLL